MIPTMTSFHERAVLRDWIALNHPGCGHVVEIGALAGASTLAIAQGMEAAKADGVLFVYDSFTLPGNQFDKEYRRVLGAKVSANFRKLFERNVWRHRITVIEGDAAAATDIPPDIEILHLDCAISEAFHRTVYEKFFPRLTLGATLVQQDYHWKYATFIPKLMDRLLAAGFFKEQIDVGSSRYFEVVKEMTVEGVREALT